MKKEIRLTVGDEAREADVTFIITLNIPEVTKDWVSGGETVSIKLVHGLSHYGLSKLDWSKLRFEQKTIVPKIMLSTLPRHIQIVLKATWKSLEQFESCYTSKFDVTSEVLTIYEPGGKKWEITFSNTGLVTWKEC